MEGEHFGRVEEIKLLRLDSIREFGLVVELTW